MLLSATLRRTLKKWQASKPWTSNLSQQQNVKENLFLFVSVQSFFYWLSTTSQEATLRLWSVCQSSIIQQLGSSEGGWLRLAWWWVKLKNTNWILKKLRKQHDNFLFPSLNNNNLKKSQIAFSLIWIPCLDWVCSVCNLERKSYCSFPQDPKEKTWRWSHHLVKQHKFKKNSYNC